MEGVSRLLRDRSGVSVHSEWLEACVKWIQEEEGAGLSEQRLYELVYEQWLHTDLSEVTPHPSLPPLTSDQGILTGSFVVQVTSLVDVGRAAYGQLQKIKGQDIDNSEGSDKKNFDPKPTRLLLLTLTDGGLGVRAMEYMPIPQLKVDTKPGTKLVLQGEIPYRLGVLLLGSDNVRVLGGEVEQLATENSITSVLSRILNLQDDVGTGSTHPTTAPSDSAHQPHPPTPTRVVLHTSHDVPHPNIGSAAPSDSDGVLQDEFDDFDIDEDELLQAELMEQDLCNEPAESTSRDEGQGCGLTGRCGLMEDRGGWAEPGHDQWSDEELGEELFAEDFDDVDAMATPTSAGGNTGGPSSLDPPAGGHAHMTVGTLTSSPTSPGLGSRFASGREQSDTDSKASAETGPHSSSVRALSASTGTTGGLPGTSSRSKLSLKQMCIRRRVVEMPLPSSRPLLPVASIRPFQRVNSVQSEPHPSQGDGEAFPLKSFSQLSPEFWLTHPVVKIHAHFVRVCDKIGHSEGVWLARVILADRFGGRLTVQLCNKILEKMIGFTAVEFIEHINPNRTDPAVRARASKGFGYCQSAIAQLNCYMVIRRSGPTELPCVLELLDC